MIVASSVKFLSFKISFSKLAFSSGSILAEFSLGTKLWIKEACLKSSFI